MITPITLKEKELIVKNVLKACKDISKLNKRGYKFLHVCSGFIAHYNLEGFKSHYEDGSLTGDIVRNTLYNQYRNFTPKDDNYAYYKSKQDVYNTIVNGLTDTKASFINDHFEYYTIGA